VILVVPGHESAYATGRVDCRRHRGGEVPLVAAGELRVAVIQSDAAGDDPATVHNGRD